MTRNRPMRAALPALCAAGLLAACNGGDAKTGGGWRVADDGVYVETRDGEFGVVRLQVIDERAMRVTASPDGDVDTAPDTMMVVAHARPDGYATEERDGALVVRTGAMSAEIALDTGRIRFRDADGRLLLAEAARSRGSSDAGWSVRQQFEHADGESYYGLGQRQDGLADLAGQNVEITTHNIIIAIPFLTSTNGYGILWNNASISRLGDPAPPQPLAAGFDLFDADGKSGVLTARYYDGERLLLERPEADLDYQFLAHGNAREQPFPDTVADAQDLRVEWSGSIVPKSSGAYDFNMYSSGYTHLAINGETLLDRWRVNWNPWFHDARIELKAGRRYPFTVDWRAQGGYFRLLQHAPAPASAARTTVVRLRSRRCRGLLRRRRGRRRRGHQRLPAAHGQGHPAAEVGLRLLAEPRTLQVAG